ncbi:MAG: FtsX-like permease family protein [Gammaproteobacteria bacterium]|nr:MAG: FtsX-like permease family protein [Gammaproteobacteria bacterium]
MSGRRILWVAMAIAVALVTAVSVATDVLNARFGAQSRLMVGGDLLIRSQIPQDVIREKLDLTGLRQAQWITFSTMAASDAGFALTQVKAISPDYPLVGEVRVERSEGPLRPGQAWIQRRLGERLGVQPGDTLALGDLDLQVSGWLVEEPDTTTGWRTLFPRALITLEDAAAASLIRPGSRARYYLALAGEPERVAAVRAQAEALNLKDVRVIQPGQGRDGVSRAIERARNYLMLVVGLGVILASIAAGVAMNSEVARLRPRVALYKTLGADRRAVFRSLIWPAWGRGVVVAGLAGWGVGAGMAAAGITTVLASQGQDVALSELLPMVSPGWFLLPGLTLLILMGALVGPQVMRILATPPVQVLRELPDTPDQRLLRRQGTWLAGAGLALLTWQYTGSWRMVMVLVAGLLLWSAFWQLLWRTVLALISRLAPVSTLAGQAVARLGQLGWRAVMMAGALGLVWCLVVVLVLFRNELLGTWAQALERELPNQFLINVMPEEKPDIETFLRERQVQVERFYPVFRGRLTEVNGTPAETREADGERIEALHRPLNLTWSSELQEGNLITAGVWAVERVQGLPAVSLEARLAERLQVDVGDTLTFDVGGVKLDARIASLREVDWESFRPNFYVIFHAPPDVPGAVTWMTSLHVPGDQPRLEKVLLERWPGVTLLDVREVLSRVREVVGQVSDAVNGLLWLLCAGAAVTVVALAREEARSKHRWVAVSRALGATRRRIMSQLVLESALSGALAGGLALAIGCALYMALAFWVFGMEPLWPPAGWLLLPVVSACLQVMLTWRQHNQLAEVSPLSLLRA